MPHVLQLLSQQIYPKTITQLTWPIIFTQSIMSATCCQSKSTHNQLTWSIRLILSTDSVTCCHSQSTHKQSNSSPDPSYSPCPPCQSPAAVTNLPGTALQSAARARWSSAPGHWWQWRCCRDCRAQPGAWAGTAGAAPAAESGPSARPCARPAPSSGVGETCPSSAETCGERGRGLESISHRQVLVKHVHCQLKHVEKRAGWLGVGGFKSIIPSQGGLNLSSTTTCGERGMGVVGVRIHHPSSATKCGEWGSGGWGGQIHHPSSAVTCGERERGVGGGGVESIISYLWRKGKGCGRRWGRIHHQLHVEKWVCVCVGGGGGGGGEAGADSSNHHQLQHWGCQTKHHYNQCTSVHPYGFMWAELVYLQQENKWEISTQMFRTIYMLMFTHPHCQVWSSDTIWGDGRRKGGGEKMFG